MLYFYYFSGCNIQCMYLNWLLAGILGVYFPRKVSMFTNFSHEPSIYFETYKEPQNLRLIRKFVQRMKRRKHKIDNG